MILSAILAAFLILASASVIAQPGSPAYGPGPIPSQLTVPVEPNVGGTGNTSPTVHGVAVGEGPSAPYNFVTCPANYAIYLGTTGADPSCSLTLPGNYSFTGNPEFLNPLALAPGSTAQTQTLGDSSTAVATDAFVANALSTFVPSNGYAFICNVTTSNGAHLVKLDASDGCVFSTVYYAYNIQFSSIIHTNIGSTSNGFGFGLSNADCTSGTQSAITPSPTGSSTNGGFINVTNAAATSSSALNDYFVLATTVQNAAAGTTTQTLGAIVPSPASNIDSMCFSIALITDDAIENFTATLYGIAN
jgi:hypothetical protein